jgi:F-type H+-transporting ATPase subunit alpha
MLEVPVGYLLIGAIVDALGVSLDVTGEIINHSKSTMRLIEVKAPGIIPRKSVNEPMRTGLKAVDSIIPIGRGQRELIIGDRQTGKTTIALDAILLNKYSATTSLTNALFSIYVAIGQKRSNIIQLVRNLRRRGAFGLCTIVSATSSDSAALQYLAPYSGCAIGE